MRKSIYNPDNNVLKQLLIGTRKASGLTQTVLSKKIGKPQSFVSKYESGQRRLDVIEFIEISKALGVDPAEMIKKITTKVL